VFGHVIFTFYNLFVILYSFITFDHVVVPSEFTLYTHIIFVDTHLNTEHIVTGFEVLLVEYLHGSHSYRVWSLVGWIFTWWLCFTCYKIYFRI